MAVTKRKRTKKTSRGVHGSTHFPLDPIQRVLLDKGQMDSIRHVDCKVGWRGVGEVKKPFDAKQAAENRRLYPHLFFEGVRR